MYDAESASNAAFRYPECRGAVFRPSYADDGSYDDTPSNSRLLSEPPNRLRLERVRGYHGSGFYPFTDNNAYFLGENHLNRGTRKSGGTKEARLGEGGGDGHGNAGAGTGFEIVYPIAALVVIQRFPSNPGEAVLLRGGDEDEKESQQQRYFDGHDDDVTALAVHPGGVVVASGQVGRIQSFRAF